MRYLPTLSGRRLNKMILWPVLCHLVHRQMEVLGPQVTVSARHLNRGMPENAAEVVEIAIVPRGVV
jgi:hypothetical protein